MVAYVGPSRGGWQFRNVTQEFDFTPTLESIEITDTKPEDVATFTCEVVDTAGTLVFQPEDKVWVKFDGLRIFAGHIKRRGRGQRSEVGPRSFLLECQDYTAKADDSVITRKKDRKAETIRNRIRWAHKHLNYEMDLDLSGVPSDERIDAANYHGMTTLEAFDHIASETSLFWEVDFDDDEDGVPTLSFFRTITAVAQFDLDNSAPDFADTFPYREFVDYDDSTDLATMVYVIPEKTKQATWVVDATQRAIYGWQQSSITDTSVKGSTGATRLGGKFLDEFDQPLTEGNCIVHEPGLRSGQKVHIVNALWGLDYDRYITSVTTTAIDPEDEAGEAYLRSYIEFSDRRKVHRRPARPIQGDIAIPTDPETVLTFPNPTTPPTQSDGDPISLTWAGRMAHGRDMWDVSIYYPPTWTTWPGTGGRYMTSSLRGYRAWTSVASWSSAPHGLLDNQFCGFDENEMWLRCLMPAIPAGAAGIEFDMPISNTSGGIQGPGAAEVSPVEIVALDAQPTTMGQGTLVGSGHKGDTVTVTVPADLLPAEGEYLYVGYRTGWHCQGVANPYAEARGWTWPFMSNSYNLGWPGNTPYCGYSGRVVVGASPIVGTWKVWDAAAPDLGSTPAGNTINDAGYTGDPTAWSVADGKLAVVADEPSSKGVYVAGYRENEDPDGAWSDGQWAARIHFVATGTGSTTDAGTREIQLTTTSEGERSVGTVHMGDANRAEGISVSGAAATDYQAQALTEDVEMVAMFDTRNADQIRGKMWVASEGEPTEWVVFADIGQTEDDQDRFTLWLRGGNDGTEQGVTGVWVESVEGAAPGQHVVGAFIGYASGYEKTFYTPDKFKGGTLKVFVNGKLTPTVSEDGQATTFQLDWWPTHGCSVIVDYIASGGADE